MNAIPALNTRPIGSQQNRFMKGAKMHAESTGELLMVVDVPHTSTPDQAARSLNEPLERGYYLVTVAEAPERVRAIYRRRTQNDSEKQAAAAFVRANPQMTVPQLIAGLAAKGITRSREWAKRAKEDVANGSNTAVSR